MPEKRNITRHRKRLQLRYGTESESPVTMAFTEDISEDGLFIRTTRIYPLNTNLNIELFTKDGNGVVNIQGVVRWVKAVPSTLIHGAKKGGMGVKIISITAGEGIYKKLLQSN
ncbi:MAG: PilZ domain-containing protein [Deltaproteobacteria bacterium]|nr:PilZ domain-containing protein [Deltaproteobacteria bacterium]